ncbi:hypothetical protein [Vibrio algarum]|uniref:Uncharacterized protein n=1 Tax=Vibrio algarum TaxID=3020714 RepID=A0ABT4YXR0_9VIBR|nr:hypothetical protein [Vibrio sp. KJ40-1]MDB1126182.1 hypothetical protein [Vibrio sp. KJ40-1]
MGQKQFEEFQTNVALLSHEQLKKLHDEIETKLDNKPEPLINEEELELISSLFC